MVSIFLVLNIFTQLASIIRDPSEIKSEYAVNNSKIPIQTSESAARNSSSGKTMYDPKWDDLAIALKSGKDVALERVPIQLLTFLADVRNKIIIGDDNVTIGEYEMIDVVNKHYNTLGNTLRKSKIYCRNHVRTRSLETE